jgi:hypothetical protein
MVTLEQGSLLSSMAIERLNSWIESRAVHHTDLPGVPSLICLHSLLDRLQNNNPA